jgi:uncharacterized glyoxalase superfamily protein PhnB
MNTKIITNLGYRDAPAAIRFLVEAFGFAEHVVYKEETRARSATPISGGRTAAASPVHSAEPDGSSVADLTARAAAAGGYPGFSMQVNISDPDDLFERAVAAGARVVREVQDSPQGPLPRLARDDHGEWRPADASPS